VVERAVVVYARGRRSPRAMSQKPWERRAFRLRWKSRPPLFPDSTSDRERSSPLLPKGAKGGETEIAKLMAAAAWARERAGHSRRTVQNDLRKLSDLGYLIWVI